MGWGAEEQEMQRQDSEYLRREHEADLRWEYRDERGGGAVARNRAELRDPAGEPGRSPSSTPDCHWCGGYNKFPADDGWVDCRCGEAA